MLILKNIYFDIKEVNLIDETKLLLISKSRGNDKDLIQTLKEVIQIKKQFESCSLINTTSNNKYYFVHTFIDNLTKHVFKKSFL